MYIFVNAIRFFLFFAAYPINSKIGLGSSLQEVTFAAWGGLRGAVGITLALALDTFVYDSTVEGDAARETTSKLFGMIGGIALLTLVLNGMTAGPLLAKLGLSHSTKARRTIMDAAENALRSHLLDDFIHLMTDRKFAFVDYAVVRRYCPRLRDLTAEELANAVEENKRHVHPNKYIVSPASRPLASIPSPTLV